MSQIDPESYDTIAALSLLCQGYLVVHSDPSGNPDFDPTHSAFNDCQRALDVMGWRPQAMGSIAEFRLEDAGSRRQFVSRTKWWSDVLPATEDLILVAGKTIGFNTARLLRMIREPDAYVPPAIVASAYLELVPFLGAQENEGIIHVPKPTIHLIDSWEPVIEAIVQDSNILYTMDWRRFEDLVARLLERFGWEVEPMGYTKDDGIDILAVRRVDPGIDFRMLVQCKRYALDRKIEMDFVKQLWATKWEHGFHHAMLATTSTFTKGARDKAELWRLDLKDHDAIVDWCRRYVQR